MWSNYKFFNSGEFKIYEEYEGNPKLVLTETKEILDSLKKEPENFHFQSFNSAIPSFTCSTLIKFYSNDLSEEERDFCKDIIMEYATAPLHENYGYQISDGVEVAINAIPFLYDLFPNMIEELNFVLFLILLDLYPIGEYKRVCDYSIESIINTLWHKSPENAKKIILRFLKFKPIVSEIEAESIIGKGTQFQRRGLSQIQLISNFISKYGENMETSIF